MKDKFHRFTLISLGFTLALALSYILFGAMAASHAARAQQPVSILTVTTINDAGPGSLRQALLAANAAPGLDHVVFDIAGCAPASPCVVGLQSPLPQIQDAIVITGTGVDSLIIDANSAFRALRIDAVPATIADLTIQNGNTAGRGAGIRTLGQLTLHRVHLLNNRALGSGGAVYAEADVIALDTVFEGNSGDHGGGLYTEFAAVLTRTTFISNAAAGHGGGLTSYVALIGQGHFAGNTSLENGGGAYADHVSALGAVFAGNRARGHGGGLAGFGQMHLQDVSFEGNQALNGDGGGLSMSIMLALAPTTVATPAGLGQSLTLTRAHFINNTAAAAGGAIALYGPLSLDSATFISNTANLGGALFHEHGNGHIANTLFARNNAALEGDAIALYLDASSSQTVTLTHATVVGAPGSDDAGIGLGAGSLVVNNTILADLAVGIRVISGTVDEDYLLFHQNGVDLEGNVNSGGHSLQGDPHFVSPGHNDFHLSAASAAIDSGAAVGIFEDFEGHARPLGVGFDIGFDEADLITGLDISYTPYPTATVNLPVTFTTTVATGSNVTYLWQFGDGSPSQTGNVVAHTFSAPGLYDVTVAATNSAGTITQSVQVETVDTGIAPPPDQIFLPIFVK